MKAKSDAQIDGRVLEKRHQKAWHKLDLRHSYFSKSWLQRRGRLTRGLREACQRADAGHLELSAMSTAVEDRRNCCPKARAK